MKYIKTDYYLEYEIENTAYENIHNYNNFKFNYNENKNYKELINNLRNDLIYFNTDNEKIKIENKENIINIFFLDNEILISLIFKEIEKIEKKEILIFIKNMNKKILKNKLVK